MDRLQEIKKVGCIKVGMLRKISKNTITKREFYKNKKYKEKNKELKLSKCLLMNQLPHFSEDQQYHQMDKCSYYHVEYGEAVPLKIPYVVRTCSEKITLQNHHLPFRPVNNLF